MGNVDYNRLKEEEKAKKISKFLQELNQINADKKKIFEFFSKFSEYATNTQTLIDKVRENSEKRLEKLNKQVTGKKFVCSVQPRNNSRRMFKFDNYGIKESRFEKSLKEIFDFKNSNKLLFDEKPAKKLLKGMQQSQSSTQLNSLTSTRKGKV